jgi:hypothetical protein
MPPRGVRRIDRRLIHQSAWKVYPRKSITAILHDPLPIEQPERVFQSQFANARIG